MAAVMWMKVFDKAGNLTQVEVDTDLVPLPKFIQLSPEPFADVPRAFYVIGGKVPEA